MKGLIFQQQVVVEENMPNLTSASGEASVSSGNRNEIGPDYPPQQQYFAPPSSTHQTTLPLKKRRNLPGNPDPDAEVIALSPKSLLATNRFICEICNKGFKRDQNLQLHKRGHNLPWKLKQRTNKEARKKVYVCPEPTCVHHDPARALGHLTGIKKHFCRTHGEKWKCDKFSTKHAVQSDWKARSKTWGTREYRCDCGTLFSRIDSFLIHTAFCDALAAESARTNPLLHHPQPPPIISSSSPAPSHILNLQTNQDLHSLQLKKEHHYQQQQQQSFNLPPWLAPGPSSTIYLSSPPPSSSIFDQDFSQTLHGHHHENPNPTSSTSLGPTTLLPPPFAYQPAPSLHMSATALLQQAAQMGSTITKTASASAPASSNMIRTHHHTHVPLIPPPSHSSDPSAINSSSGNFGLNMSSRESAVLLPPSAPASSSFLLHDVMSSFFGTSGGGGFEGTSFVDAFGGILGSKNNKDGSFLDTRTKITTISAGHLSGAATGDDGGENEGLTRDFLGLTSLSHNEILSFAGIENCMNPTSHDHQKQSQKPWQAKQSDMASSSSTTPSPQPPKKYDVFISFRGEDTRFNFISHLHEALCRNQIETYIDYKLEKGGEVWHSLEKAIEDSTLFLVIFSEKYASSTWCLKELTKILEGSKNKCDLVMPVFYRVDPSHVRKQSGSYQKAFEELKRKSINKQQLQKWREALTHAANLSGWDCSFNRDEAELIKEIVNCVIQRLARMYQSEDYLKGLIGIHKRMTDVELLLDKSSNNVQFIGIWGMGGIGKTTLAKVLFHKLRFAYEGFCFMARVREESRKYGIDALREKLILKLLGDTKSHIGMIDSVSPFAMSRLGRKKVFIVLDDVDDHEQLENLARRHEFGSGSKVLITTRDKQVLGKELDDIYQLKALNPLEAFHLFSINAFRNDYADPKVRELAEKVTQYANGNPLALKVLGSFLDGKDQEEWKSQLSKLQKLPFPKINDILKLSLEGLDYEEKNIFLYIACFFSYYDVQEVNNLLDACGYSTKIGLTRLEDKSLLDIHGRRICMHHLIKEMGIQIVREESLNDPRRCNILWIFKKNSEILKKNTGSEAVEGIILNLSEVYEMCLSNEAFCSMPNLKFLCVYGNLNDQVGNELKFPSGIEFLPKNLKLLRWAEYPLKSLPTTFNVENLVQIELPNSNLTKLWDGVQNLVNLSKIDLSRSKNLIELPDFSKAIHLAEVELSFCSNLQSVHPSILSLHSLRRLLLFGCEALTSLISNTHLKSLSELHLGSCSRLNKFSVTSENSGFQLKLSYTSINGELRSSSGHLSKIHSLELLRCKNVTSLHKLVDLRNLTRLTADGCNELASNLRSIFDEMRALQVLSLYECSESFEVPDNISLLSSFCELNLSRSNVKALPLSIKRLSSLRRLYLDGSERLRSLPQLPPSISTLSAMNCHSLGTLHSPLTNEIDYDKQIKWNLDPHFIFTNCMKLDTQSIKAVEEKVVLEINKAIHDSVEMKYPGKSVPEWFMYRTTQSFITVDLGSIPQPWDGNFIFCVVMSDSRQTKEILVKWFIDGQYACMSYCENHPTRLRSDHVCFWYDRKSCGEVQRKIEEKKRDAQSNTYHPLLQLQFMAKSFFVSYGRVSVAECGVCPTSASKYQKYIKQIQLGLASTSSRKRKYHSLPP